MKTQSVHALLPGEISGTMRDIAGRFKNISAQAKAAGASELAGDLSAHSDLLAKYVVGIEQAVTVTAAGDTVSLLLVLSLVDEELQEVAALARLWPVLSPECLEAPLRTLSERLDDLLHNLQLVREAIPPIADARTVN